MSEVSLSLPMAAPARVRASWIVSPAFDVPLLILAPLATLPLVLIYAQGITVVAFAVAMTLAFAHYMSSVPFFFWDDNRAYHRSRWLAFYAGPFIIAAVYFFLIFNKVPNVIQFVLLFWNTYHVARQNCGIVSIYRTHSGVRDAPQRNATNAAIILTSVFLATWNINTHDEISSMFRFAGPDFGVYLRIGFGAVAAAAMILLGRALWQRRRTGQPITLAEAMLLGTSLLFFYPYLFIQSSETATGAMLIPHYVQYMSLVWLLHRRKFGGRSDGAPPLLRQISSRISLLLPVLAAAGFFFYASFRVTAHFSHREMFEIAYLLIAFEHFYLDGLIWSFKQPHVRQTIGPFLQPTRAA